ncbi:hypothetical protein MATL_G00107310 [Megalops atlanticus]|uniref:Uncharacterized protein n=1 Tax=Megalops atlanticus TaxID=7932 RepID=A0A9D3Q037_MEGAT|nr:hypothetical protein MATL_G00107310 [Megalops atlanticus]
MSGGRESACGPPVTYYHVEAKHMEFGSHTYTGVPVSDTPALPPNTHHLCQIFICYPSRDEKQAEPPTDSVLRKEPWHLSERGGQSAEDTGRECKGPVFPPRKS